jgi:hypothetical protein
MYLRSDYTNAEIIKVDCEYDLFYNEWRKSLRNQNLDFLYQVLKPYIRNWANMLTSGEAERNKSFYYLCYALSQKEVDPLSKIESWVHRAEMQASLVEELELILISALRAPKFLVSTIDGRRGASIFDKYFTYYLINDMLKVSEEVDLAHSELTFLSTEECFADSDFQLSLEMMGLSQWDMHIINLVVNEYSDNQISTLFHKQVRLIAKEKRELWQRLKKM